MPAAKTIGQYELVGILGRGSFGTVWEARHAALGRLAAVKVLDRLAAGEHHADRFLREAQISGNLHHPHIVTLLESGQAEYEGRDTPFLAYALVEGVTLREWCKFSRLSWRETAALVAKLASAVHYAHERGVVHRDLKPDNVLVDLSGEPHVTDFGLARRPEDRLTEQNVALGTIAYMSPEQASGDSANVGPASDIFSVGVILFELLTGELPFKSTTISGYVSEVARTEPSLTSHQARRIPRDLATICLKCLAKKPADRYASAQALEEDLRRFVAGKPIEARPVSLPERLRRWAVRQPLAATLVGLLAIAAIVGPTVAVHQARLSSELAQTATNLRATNYSTDLYLAYQAWNEGRLKQTRQILDRSLPPDTEPDLRCFAWHFLNDRVNEAYRVVARSDVPINDFAVTQDRGRLLTVGAGGTLDAWNLATGHHERSLPLSYHEQFAVAVLGNSILVGDHRNGMAVLDIYDFESGRRTRSLPLGTENKVESIRVSGDEAMYAVGTRYHGIHLFDAAGTKSPSENHRGLAQFGESSEQIVPVPLSSDFFANLDRNENVALSPDSRYLAASFNEETDGKHNYGVSVWDLRDASLVNRRNFNAKVDGLAWRPDSNYLVAHVANHHEAFLISLPNLDTIREIPHGRRSPLAADFYPDGRTMLGADQLGSLFARPISFEAAPYGGVDYLPHEAEVNRMRYMGQGEVLSVSDDGTAVISHPGKLQRHGVNVLMTVGEEGRLAYSTSKDRFFVGDRDGILRDHRGNVLHTFDQRINALALMASGTQLACGLHDGTIVIVDAANGSVVNTLKSKQLDEGSRAVNSTVDCAPAGLVSGGNASVLRFWPSQAKLPTIAFQVSGRIPAVAVDESRQLAFAAGHSERIAAVELETGQEVFRLMASRATALAIDAKRSRLISGHADSSIIVWDLATRTKIKALRGHSSRVHSLAINSDGDILASAGGDGSIRFWNLARLTEIGIAYQNRSGCVVNDLAFSRDGRSLYCTSTAPHRRSLVLRIGSPRQPFDGYDVSPRELDYRDNVDVQFTKIAGTEVLTCQNRRDGPAAIGVWLDERCKGYEVRATFHFDLTAGTARAFLDHFYAKDRDNIHEGNWHGMSPEIQPGQDLTVKTDWVRISHGDWYAGADEAEHSYGAVLLLDPVAKARIRSVEIEAREIQ